jgi:hypothetical protein
MGGHTMAQYIADFVSAWFRSTSVPKRAETTTARPTETQLGRIELEYALDWAERRAA